jgi:hypothetical protein
VPTKATHLRASCHTHCTRNIALPCFDTNLPTTRCILYANYVVGHHVPTKATHLHAMCRTALGTSRFRTNLPTTLCILYANYVVSHRVLTKATHLRAACHTALGTSCFLLEHRASSLNIALHYTALCKDYQTYTTRTRQRTPEPKCTCAATLTWPQTYPPPCAYHMLTTLSVIMCRQNNSFACNMSPRQEHCAFPQIVHCVRIPNHIPLGYTKPIHHTAHTIC